MNILIPKIIILYMTGIGLFIMAYKHGQPQKDYNFWVHLILVCITVPLLLWSWGFRL